MLACSAGGEGRLAQQGVARGGAGLGAGVADVHPRRRRRQVSKHHLCAASRVLQPAASCRYCQHVRGGPHLTSESTVDAGTHIMNSAEPRASSHDDSSGSSSGISESCWVVAWSSDKCTDAPAQRRLCAACGAAAACSRCSSPAAGSCKRLTGRCRFWSPACLEQHQILHCEVHAFRCRATLIVSGSFGP
jgi:hypothetical protein